jgi:GT2 family glycosyltransferase
LNAGLEFSKVVSANVAAVIVNWRQPKLTIEAAYAVARQTVKPAVVVVDNGSGDDSVSQLKAALPSALIVERDTNGGFGTGCNAGIECAMSLGVDYVWLINNDAVPDEYCLQHLLAKANSESAIGVVGACIRDPKGTVADHAGCVMSRLSFNCRSTLSELEISKNHYAWITGASMLLSVSVLREIGLFDVGYFMYWEDADLCCRIRRAGYKLAVAGKAVVAHEAGTSSSEMRLTRYRWHIDSQIRWVVRNYSNVIFGVLLIYSRHIIKSIKSADWARFVMTVKSIKTTKENLPNYSLPIEK